MKRINKNLSAVIYQHLLYNLKKLTLQFMRSQFFMFIVLMSNSFESFYFAFKKSAALLISAITDLSSEAGTISVLWLHIKGWIFAVFMQCSRQTAVSYAFYGSPVPPPDKITAPFFSFISGVLRRKYLAEKYICRRLNTSSIFPVSSEK